MFFKTGWIFQDWHPLSNLELGSCRTNVGTIWNLAWLRLWHISFSSWDKQRSLTVGWCILNQHNAKVIYFTVCGFASTRNSARHESKVVRSHKVGKAASIQKKKPLHWVSQLSKVLQRTSPDTNLFVVHVCVCLHPVNPWSLNCSRGAAIPQSQQKGLNGHCCY